MTKRLKDMSNKVIKSMQLVRSIKPYLGSDPEFFVADKTGVIMPSDKFFPDKENPLKINNNNEGSKMFFDGIQAEINFPAATCRESIVYYIREGLQFAKNKIGKDYTIVIEPSVEMTQQCIDDADPEARRFGCMPDFNAYTLDQNTPEMDASKHMLRYAGGHIHVGISSPYIKENDNEYKVAKTPEGHLKVIKMMDYMAGVMLIMMDKSQAAVTRRSKYGKAGCFRPTPYGVEYRTPSCWWMKSPASLSLVFGLIRLAWNLCISNGQDELLIEEMGYSLEDARCIIDESNVQEAEKFWNKLRPYVSIMSNSTFNPLHIASLKGGNSETVSTNYLESVLAGDMPLIHFFGHDKKKIMLPLDKTYAIFPLAAFDYMLINGIENFITSNIQKEWQFVENSDGKFSYNPTTPMDNGFISRAFRLFKDNADFRKYQMSYAKDIL